MPAVGSLPSGPVSSATQTVGPVSSPEDGSAIRPDNGSWFPIIAFLVVAGAVIALSVLAHARLPLLHHRHRQLQGRGWVSSFSWWDGWWYVGIARHGYAYYRPGGQSPVAFFPLYPLMMRAVGRLTGGALVAGFLLTVACGMGASVLFHQWCLKTLGSAQARLAVLVLLLYPFAFYLMGAVYGDALFLFAALAAFLAFEHDRQVLAGLAAALATAARPVGVAVVVGLWVLALERRGVLGRARQARVGPGGVGWGRFSAADASLLLAPVGLLGYCGFLWARFRRPFAFLDTAGAKGWDQPAGFHTWFKVHWIKAMWHGPWTNGHFGHLAVNALATVIVAAFIPAVFRRLGIGYGVFVVIAVVATAVSTKDFVGMGRYSLAAFPCFAMAADLLISRPRMTRVVLVVGTANLVMLAQLHAPGAIIS